MKTYLFRMAYQLMVNRLKRRSRMKSAVILLTYYHDLTQKDIPKILEIPVGTVKSRLHPSLNKLKISLEGKE